MLNVKGKSQYDEDIDVRIRASACGPVTAHVMMKYNSSLACPYDVNELYSRLGGTVVGLSKWRFIRNMRKVLGPNWIVDQCTVEELKRQIDEGRPVAAKFDKWFNFRWFGHYQFDYHWVPVVGYELKDNDTVLIIHDNGGRNRESMIQHISFNRNSPVLSFVKIEPSNIE